MSDMESTTEASVPGASVPGTLRILGYWSAGSHIMVGCDGLPDVRRFVQPDWPHKEQVVTYLRNAPKVISYRGLSMCRICKKMNGSIEQSDGVYLWPGGLAHYIEDHDVVLPDEFVTHVLAGNGYLPMTGISPKGDLTWWLETVL